jgi:hypothetical protein
VKQVFSGRKCHTFAALTPGKIAFELVLKKLLIVFYLLSDVVVKCDKSAAKPLLDKKKAPRISPKCPMNSG